MSTFGERVRALRRAKGQNFTQEVLAQKAGLSVSYVSRVEAGLQLNPRRGTVESLAAALDVHPSALEWGTDQPLPLPSVEAKDQKVLKVIDGAARKVLDLWPELSEADKMIVVNMVRNLVAARRKE